jgi:membrane protein DedA with SNARE-associated domain
MNEFVTKWGYLAVFLGSLIEGESIILPAGYFASQGCLSLYKIILIAFVGTVIADQTLFVVGKKFGQRLLKKFPHFQKPAEKALRFLEVYDTWFMLTFRFIYGIRIISPVVIGLSHIQFVRFSILNIIAAAIWSVVSCSVGYFFGEVIMNHLSPMQRFFALGSVGFLFLLLLLWKAWKFFYKKDSP